MRLRICADSSEPSLLARFYKSQNLVYQIMSSSGCSNAVGSVARLAASWNLPIFTYGGTNIMLENKTEFSTLTRLAYSVDGFSHFYFDIFRVS